MDPQGRRSKEATMRPARIIVAAALAVAAIATGSYLALSTTSHPAAAPTAPVSAAAPASSAAGSELADGRHPVLLKAIDPRRQRGVLDHGAR
jgi:hypothetical protein